MALIMNGVSHKPENNGISTSEKSHQVEIKNTDIPVTEGNGVLVNSSQKSHPDLESYSSVADAIVVQQSEGNSRINKPSSSKLKKEQLIESMLGETKENGSFDIDLSNKQMHSIPAALLQIVQLQHLYLSSNCIRCLPDNFFDCLPNISWLDLRHNELIHLPSTYISSHQCLHNLLLQGNSLKTLPLELGLVKTLTGLNVADNPLEFPPPDVLDKGTSYILKYFRDCLRCKSQGKAIPGVEDLEADAASNSSGEGRRGSTLRHSFSNPTDSQISLHSVGEYDDLVPSTSSAGLHRQTSYSELKQLQKEKIVKAGASGTFTKPTSSRQVNNKNTKLKKLSSYPEPPPPEIVNEKFMEEMRNAQRKKQFEKQDHILQKRRDDDSLKQWQQDAKQKQQEKYRESYLYGGAKEKVDIAGEAPYAVEDKHMKVLTNEQRIAEDIREKHEKMRKALSPVTRQRIEEAKLLRERELEDKIRVHTLSMQSRRGKSHGTPQEEMQAAKRELQVAEQLHQEVQARRKEVEYRLQAFTGDT